MKWNSEIEGILIRLRNRERGMDILNWWKHRRMKLNQKWIITEGEGSDSETGTEIEYDGAHSCALATPSGSLQHSLGGRKWLVGVWGVILEFLPGLRCSFSVTFGDANTRELAGVECLYRVGLVLIGLDGKNTLSFLPLLTAHKRQKMPPLPRHPNLLFFIFLPFSTYSTTFIL